MHPCRTWCARHGLNKTFALPEEHQSNGRAEGTIMRIKSRTRVLLQEAGCEPSEWPLASKLAAHAMRNHARKILNMTVKPTLPYNSKVQILQRFWNRGVWESVTTTARTKGPSSDSSRGWIVKTSEGKLLTTGTLFPAPRADQKLEFTCPGEPILVSEPERRIRGKTTLKAFTVPTAALSVSSQSSIEKWAQEHVCRACITQHLVEELVKAAALSLPTSSRDGSVDINPSAAREGAWCNNVGGYNCKGASSVTNLSVSHPWMSRALVSWANSCTSCPFAGLEIRKNVPLPMSRELQALPGTRHVILPVSPGSMQVWCQGCGNIPREVRPGLIINGGMVPVRPGCPIELAPQSWRQVEAGSQPCIYLIGHTPKGLHKLKESDRGMLLSLGFSCLPAGQGEFWTIQPHKSLLCRHHPVPRKGMFNPAACKDLPVPLECLGNLRHVTQHLADGTTQTAMHRWRDRRPAARDGKWTGVTVFQLHNLPAAPVSATGGGNHFSFFFRQDK